MEGAMTSTTRTVYFITHPDVLIDPSVPVPEWPLSPRGRDRMVLALARPCCSLLILKKASEAGSAQPTPSGGSLVLFKRCLPLRRATAATLPSSRMAGSGRCCCAISVATSSEGSMISRLTTAATTSPSMQRRAAFIMDGTLSTHRAASSGGYSSAARPISDYQTGS
jgi:hypothetical protein